MRLKVMTYNVHSCTGTDGWVNPVRIAKVIEQNDADVVALQELDSGLLRTGLANQAMLLAEMLRMDHYFHPSIHLEAGQYGNAVLSAYPMRMFRAGELPTLPRRDIKERRGAIWVKLDLGEAEVDLFNTHLGLNSHERRAQAEALIGPDWLGHPQCKGPVIFCGDLNASRWSGVYRKFRGPLRGVSTGRTWPSRFPLLRLDYIFVSPDVGMIKAMVINSSLARRASDHLPVLSELEVPLEAVRR